MPDSDKPPDSEGYYPIDVENIAEMARLTKQAHIQLDMTGPFPEPIEIQPGSRILDIGCGPAVWALEVAQQTPESEVTGIDISTLMIEYARSHAQSLGLTNTSFLTRDAHQPLPFPDNTFDYINLGAAIGYISPTGWPNVLKECYRILRPGGIFCSTESEGMGFVTTPALARLFGLIMQALRQIGQSFAPEGPLFGITAVQRKLQVQAGFVQIKNRAWTFDYSAGTPGNAIMTDDYRTAMKLAQPFLIACELISQEEVETLYEQAMYEMSQKDFCGILFVQMVWGKK